MMKDTLSSRVYRNKDGTLWENTLYLQAKTKACWCVNLTRR